MLRTKASTKFNCVPKEENSDGEEESTRLKHERRDQAIQEVEARFEQVQANYNKMELLEMKAIITRDLATISEVIYEMEDISELENRLHSNE